MYSYSVVVVVVVVVGRLVGNRMAPIPITLSDLECHFSCLKHF